MTFFYIILFIILIIVTLAYLAPRQIIVERKIIVNKNPHEVYDDLKSLKTQAKWSVWHKKDPDMSITYSGIDGEVGSISSWNGNKHVGQGEQEIKVLKPYDYIETELRFLKPWKAVNTGFYIIHQLDHGTEITWGFKMENKFPFSLMSHFMNFDKAVGKDFEEGLKNFKEHIEH